jgi:hypothetical protein
MSPLASMLVLSPHTEVDPVIKDGADQLVDVVGDIDIGDCDARGKGSYVGKGEARENSDPDGSRDFGFV